MRAAAANVESVFSGAGKFTDEASSAGHVLLRRMVKLHYNWKYEFVRPTVDEVCERYKVKHAQGGARPAVAGSPRPHTPRRPSRPRGASSQASDYQRGRPDQHIYCQIRTIFVCMPHMLSDQNYPLCVYAACVSGRV